MLEFSPFEITILRSYKPATKVYTNAGVQAYSKELFFDYAGTCEVTDLDGFVDLLSMAAADPHLLAIRGQFDPSTCTEQVASVAGMGDHDAAMVGEDVVVKRRTTVFKDVPRRWVCIDVDDVSWDDLGMSGPDFTATGAEALFQYVTLHYTALQDAGYVCQWSSSAGIKDGARAHLWVLLDEARDQGWWRWISEALGVPFINKAGAKYRTKGNETFDFDVAVTRAVQPNYIANPVFKDGISDPVPVRVIKKEGPVLNTSVLEAAAIAASGRAYTVLAEASKGDVVTRDRTTGRTYISKAATNVQGEFESLLEQVGKPVSPLMGLNRLQPVLDLLKTLAEGTLNPGRFEAAKLVPQTRALELMGYKALLDALVRAMMANPYATQSGDFYRAEFERLLAYAYVGYTLVKPERSLSTNPVVKVKGRYITPEEIEACDTRLVLIKSPMGTGKTTAIAALLAKHPDTFTTSVAPRRSLVRTAATDFDLEHYSDGDINAKRVATTLHSLHKRHIRRDGILILDEVEQYLEVLTTEVDDVASEVLLVLKHAIQTARFVVGADAHLGWRTGLLLELFGVGLSEVTILKNDWRPMAKVCEVLFGARKVGKGEEPSAWCAQRDHAVDIFVKHVKARRGLAVASCTSKNQASKLALAVEDADPSAKVLLITSEQAWDEDVEAFFGDADGEIVKYDCAVFSPSVQSGVSIDVPVALNICFANLGAWTTPNKAAQQLGRVRNASRTIVVADPTNYNLQTSAADIQDGWDRDRINTFGGLLPKMDLDGFLRYFPADPGLIQAAAELEAGDNHERNMGLAKLTQILREEEGYTIKRTTFTCTNHKEAKEKRETRKALREAQLEEEARQIHQTPAATPHQVQQYMDKGDLEQDEHRAMMHGLVAMYLNEAPSLDDVVRVVKDGKWSKQAKNLAALLLTPEDFELAKLYEMDLVAEGRASAEALHKSGFCDQTFLRELLEAADMMWVVDASLEDDERTYCPTTHFTPDVIQEVDKVRKKWDKGLGTNARTYVHQAIRYQLGLSTKRVHKTIDGEKVKFYTFPIADLAELLRWINQPTSSYLDHAQAMRSLTTSTYSFTFAGGAALEIAQTPTPGDARKAVEQKFIDLAATNQLT